VRLAGKVAIVTGAAMGIGKGIAAVFAREGARVVLADVDAEAGRAAEDELRGRAQQAVFVRADVSDEAQVRELVATAERTYGALHVLVNNAGIGVYTRVPETSREQWDRCLAVNLTGVFLCCKHAIPLIKASGGGSIVNIASVHAYQNVGATAPYAASKGGVVALTRVMAIDHARDGIRVNAICPGWVDTPLIRGIFAASPDPEGMRRQVAGRQLLGRLGTPEDIGHAALYLASDEASFVTGASLFVDSGLTAQLETW
jgi:NAD(P)-dependent dehydrogenase (short-subunit alcohol dehydrogenase family)